MNMFISQNNKWVFCSSGFRFTCKILSIFKEGLFKDSKTSNPFFLLSTYTVCEFWKAEFSLMKISGRNIKTKQNIFQTGWRTSDWAHSLENNYGSKIFLEFLHLLIKPVVSLLGNGKSELSLHLGRTPWINRAQAAVQVPTKWKGYLLVAEAGNTAQPQWTEISWEGKLVDFKNDVESPSGLTHVVSDDEWPWRW